MIKDALPSTIDEILKAYGIKGRVTDWHMNHIGHINRTYIICCTDDEGELDRRLLQQINTNAFRKPIELMDNIVRVTDYLREKISEDGGDCARETLTVYKTVDGKSCFVDSKGNHWRFYNVVENAFSYDTIDDPQIFYDAGAAFGKFQSRLAMFPIETLYETIPDFHHTYKRFLNLKAAAENNAAGRLNEAEPELAFAYAREDDTKVLVDMLEKGELPLRVTHNDTKLNNIMFDNDTKKPVCVVDLDTVMPGLSLYDFGDAIRYGANTAAEDEKDLSKVSLDLNLYEKYVTGFLSSAGKSLTENEVKMLPFSAKLLTLECGMRFLTDFLDGDVYFNTAYPEHNMDRCRTQFALVADIEKKYDKMVEITQKAYSAL